MVAIALGKYILYLTDLRCIWLCSIVSCLCYTVKVGLYFRRRLAPHAPPHDAPRAPVRSIRWRGPAGVNLRKRPSKKYKRTRV